MPTDSCGSDYPDRPQTVPELGPTAEPGLELVGAEGSTELPRQDSNLRPVDAERTQPRAREQKSKRLARTKSRRKSRNAPESDPSDRTQTVPGEKERDA